MLWTPTLEPWRSPQGLRHSRVAGSQTLVAPHSRAGVMGPARLSPPLSPPVLQAPGPHETALGPTLGQTCQLGPLSEAWPSWAPGQPQG